MNPYLDYDNWYFRAECNKRLALIVVELGLSLKGKSIVILVLVKDILNGA